MTSTLIYNCRFAGQKKADSWVLISGEYITKIGSGEAVMPSADKKVDAKGALLLPGAIDCHVHFREPGLTHKGDIATESKAAIAGGVTSFMDMPNCKPATTTIEMWEEKCRAAAEKSLANYAFFIGATNDNLDQLREADYGKVPGVKLFMGSSTGNMLVDDEKMVNQIFREVNAIMAVHAEDQCIISANAERAKGQYGDKVPLRMHSRIRSVEACYVCSAHAVAMAKANNRRLHICHVSTAKEIELLSDKPIAEKLITSEVSPHHLLWCDTDYETKGARIKMNPSVKTKDDRAALRQALIDGKIDMVATDHAPHLLVEKEGDALTAVSGAPMVQFSLVLMLEMFDETLVQRVMCENPAKVYNIKSRGFLKEGYYADLVLVADTETYAINDSMVYSKCGWTPAAGQKVSRQVAKTWVNGKLMYDGGKFAEGRNVKPLLFKQDN